MLDWLIEGGTVVDGSGGAPFADDVGIQDGRIVEVGRISAAARRSAPMSASATDGSSRSAASPARHASASVPTAPG